MKITNFFYSYYKSLILFLLILIASVLPTKEIEHTGWITMPNFDKFVHFAMYFIFTAILIYDVLKSSSEITRLKSYLFSISVAIIYGGSIEIIQGSLTQTRVADIFDFLFNSIGAVMALVFWLFLKRPKSQNPAFRL
jgi:VanZ family protein